MVRWRIRKTDENFRNSGTDHQFNAGQIFDQQQNRNFVSDNRVVVLVDLIEVPKGDPHRNRREDKHEQKGGGEFNFDAQTHVTVPKLGNSGALRHCCKDCG